MVASIPLNTQKPMTADAKKLTIPLKMPIAAHMDNSVPLSCYCPALRRLHLEHAITDITHVPAAFDQLKGCVGTRESTVLLELMIASTHDEQLAVVMHKL